MLAGSDLIDRVHAAGRDRADPSARAASASRTWVGRRTAIRRHDVVSLAKSTEVLLDR